MINREIDNLIKVISTNPQVFANEKFRGFSTYTKVNGKANYDIFEVEN